MKTVQYGSEEYETIQTLGLGAGFSYNAFNHAVNYTMDAVRQFKQPSIEHLEEVRAMFNHAQACDQEFLDATDGVRVEGDGGNFELMKMVVGILRKRDTELKELLDRHYPNITLH